MRSATYQSGEAGFAEPKKKDDRLQNKSSSALLFPRWLLALFPVKASFLWVRITITQAEPFILCSAASLKFLPFIKPDLRNWICYQCVRVWTFLPFVILLCCTVSKNVSTWKTKNYKRSLTKVLILLCFWYLESDIVAKQ